MKPGSPPPPPPDDEATDPLLAALRQRLGDYGQAPPPGAWAAIRQRVAPPALPQPWWRRRPPLVLLGLLLCLVLPSRLGEWTALHRAGLPASQPQVAVAPNSVATPAALGTRAGHHAGPSAADKSTALLDWSAPGRASSVPKTPTELADLLAQPSADKLLKPSAAASGVATVATGHAAANLAHSPKGLALAKAANSGSRSSLNSSEAASTPPHKMRNLAALAVGRPTRHRQPSRWSAARPPLATEPEAASQPTDNDTSTRHTGQPASRAYSVTQAVAPSIYAPDDAAKTAARAVARRGLVAARSSKDLTVDASSTARRPQSPRAPRPSSETMLAGADSPAAVPAAPSAALAPSATSGVFPLGLVELLASNQVSLPLSAPALLATLVARPDSAPAAHPARRWALLLVAGPTLSYRTLGPSPTLAVGHPDFARLERPALGLGAQVQVRRVLSSRWALAVGLGYHEYATRLALSLKDTASVHQRDTYRLLTVPVQLGYALGAPQGRLSKALLLGAEPGWYLGGHSTEGSGCGCEQQTYTAAAGSPYRAWSLALSLGLDLRYRLGSAGSRWQWLVQPTGRYVATPFVRADAVGFTRRQPFSLGVLTGFSWDVR